MMFDLTGKTALVTGATGGIGGEIAKLFHAQGAQVVLSGTRASALEELASTLGSRVHIRPCNLSDKDSVEALIPEIEETIAPIDILVNNAGLTRDGLFMRMKDEDWSTVMTVNLDSIFRLSRAVIKGMMKRRTGRIINISSVVGVTGNPGQVNYCASKAAVIGMTKALAQEVATRGITVNAIAPGFIATAMTEELTDDQKTMIKAKIPMNAMGTSQDIAYSALYLASNEAQYVTGQTQHVNGGMVMP